MEKQEKKNTVKKVLFWALGIILAIMLMIIGTAIWMAAAIFDENPMPPVNKVPDMQQYQACLMKFQEAVLKPQDSTDALTKDQTLEFSKAEINALLDTLALSARTYLAMRLPDTTICDARFENGVLYADVSQKFLFSNPFGKYINMRLAIIPKVADQQLYLKVKSVTAGSMELSGKWVQHQIDQELRNFEQTEDGQMVIATIKGLRLEPDKVYITYNPMQLQMLLTNQMLRLFSDQSGLELKLNNGSLNGNTEDLLKLLEGLQ